MGKEPDCQASDLGSIPGQVSELFVNLILLNSSNYTRIMKKLVCFGPTQSG